MGFRKPDLGSAYTAISNSINEIRSGYNDGWTASACKKELFLLKVWFDEAYSHLQTFVGEEKWQEEVDKEKVVRILKNE